MHRAAVSFQDEVHFEFLFRDVEELSPDAGPSPLLIVRFLYPFGEHRGEFDHLAAGVFGNLFHGEAPVVELGIGQQPESAARDFHHLT